jgi:hypothetical protein
MSKSREVLAGISAATLIAIAGCGDGKAPKKTEHSPHPIQHRDYTPEIQRLGATLFKLAAEDPDQFTPDNFNALNVGIRENTKDSGQLTIEAGYGESLTKPNTVFGPLTLIVRQTFPDNTGVQAAEPNGGHNGLDIGFTLNITEDSPGVWSTECVDNDPTVTTVGEVGMKTVYFAGDYSVTNEQAAQDVLVNEIAAVRYALGIAGKPIAGDQPKPMVDACLGSFTNQP